MNDAGHGGDAEVTFAMIKPDAVGAGHVDEVLARIREEGFAVLQVRHATLTEEEVEALYQEHTARPFWHDLKAFMLSGSVVLLKLSRADAVAHWRHVLGATDARKAEPGTLRHTFGNKDGVIFRNVAHGSDSAAAASRECALWWA
jgi:nucleoside-diphosphate kinase